MMVIWSPPIKAPAYDGGESCGSGILVKPLKYNVDSADLLINLLINGMRSRVTRSLSTARRWHSLQSTAIE